MVWTAVSDDKVRERREWDGLVWLKNKNKNRVYEITKLSCHILVYKGGWEKGCQ